MNASSGPGIVLPTNLDSWVGEQRWFAGKDHTPALRSIGHWTMPSTDPGVGIHCHLLFDAASRHATVYQVPVTSRREPLTGMAPTALIETSTGDDGLPRYLYDATADPAFAAALLGFILSDGTTPTVTPTAGPAAGTTGMAARGERVLLPGGNSPIGDPAGLAVAASRVLTGEQSNTSIIIDLVDSAGRAGRPVICKVFRVVAAGENPDVSVQSALALAGSRFVPQPVGAITAEWTEPRSGSRSTGHLAFLQEFLPGVEDAWRVALASAAAGDDFTGPARALGAATAAVHLDLAGAFPTREATPDIVNQLCSSMRERYRLAAREVPELARHRDAVVGVYARAQAAPWPRLQRIHGDYHLGQVLDVPGRGWVLIDFEGEPLRPLAERTLPDIPLRDVAGMLRSFSYVGATIAQDDPAREPAATAWRTKAREAFLRGYSDQAGPAPQEHDLLLAAFELDKAIYETVYEFRNRPSWLPIPLRAVQRLAAAAAGAPPATAALNADASPEAHAAALRQL
jgi:maltokinase